MGGLGIEMLLSCVQNVGMDPRICTNDEKTPSLIASACAIYKRVRREKRSSAKNNVCWNNGPVDGLVIVMVQSSAGVKHVGTRGVYGLFPAT